jgi:hypothetical protein
VGFFTSGCALAKVAVAGLCLFVATCQLLFVTPFQCRKKGNERKREAYKEYSRQNFMLIHPTRHV